ncbi:unnamed protein product [Echinostoma caproni]|uniref:Reverse transcriptase n=1 Tax=Echinostoma caproni TaxID=27848 RepID=A0A183AHF1_9TREM|nr:unnamed protein product [Echinostoma caproni]
MNLLNLGLPSKRIILIGLPPLDEAKWGARQLLEGKPFNRDMKNCQAYVNACAQAALSTQAQFLNLYEAMIAQKSWTDMLIDGLHFSRPGSEFFAQILIWSLEEQLSGTCPILFPDWKDVDKANPEKSIFKFLHTVPNVHTQLQRLIVKCSNNSGGMNVQPAKLEVDGQPIFMKRRVIPYGQREDVLKAIEKMERDVITTRVTSSAWATPIVVAIKSDGKSPRICGDYRLTLNLQMRKCATTTLLP